MAAQQYYRVWCITELVYVYTWATSEPTVCPNNPAHTINGALTAIVDYPESTLAPAEIVGQGYDPVTMNSVALYNATLGPAGKWQMVFPLGDGNTDCFLVTKQNEWVIIRTVYFAGTSVAGVPTKVVVVASVKNEGGNGSVRVRSGGVTIAQIDNIAATTPTRYSSSSLSNLPSGEAIMEFQGVKSINNLYVYCCAIIKD